MPATMGLILLRTPIISMLLKGGNFGNLSTSMVTWALLWYTSGLVGHSVVEILSRAFYALHDTKTPVIVGSIAMSLNVGLSFTFSALFTSIGWMPHGGLALSNSLATALEMIGLYVLMRNRLKGINGTEIARGAGAAFLATCVMSLGIVAWMGIMANRNPWLISLGGFAIGIMIYGICIRLMRVPEMKELIGAFQKRMSSFMGKKGIS
jgi:putative peptidoglycan lipid II flippase